MRVKIINRFSYLADNLFSHVHLAVFAKCVIFYIKNKRTCAMKSFSPNNYTEYEEVLIGRGRDDANEYSRIFSSPHK